MVSYLITYNTEIDEIVVFEVAPGFELDPSDETYILLEETASL